MLHGPLQNGTAEQLRMPGSAVPENLVHPLRYDMISSHQSVLNNIAYDEPRPNISMGLKDTGHHFQSMIARP
jgi:hypothetical protein